jgi:hypothetical protein
VVDASLSPNFPLADAVETFIRQEDASASSRWCAATIPELAGHLRIEERELEAGEEPAPDSVQRTAAPTFAARGLRGGRLGVSR